MLLIFNIKSKHLIFNFKILIFLKIKIKLYNSLKKNTYI